MTLFDDAIGLFDSPTGLFDAYVIINGFISAQGIELIAENGLISVNNDYEKSILGQEMQSFSAEISANGSANQVINGQDLSANQGEIKLLTNSKIVINGLNLTSQLGSIGVEASSNAIVVLSGTQLISILGDVTVKVNEVINASVNLTGLQVKTIASSVYAQGENPNLFVGSGYGVYNNLSKDARISLIGVIAKSEINKVLALGEIVNNARVSINPVLVFSENEPVSANGVLDISEEELLLLLVA